MVHRHGPLPAGLVAALRHVRSLELATDSALQRSRVVVATSRLMLAATQAGWTQGAVARAAGLKPTTVQKRLTAITSQGMTGAGLLVEGPPPRPSRPPSIAAQLTAGPVEKRDVLTLTEAADFIGVPPSRVKVWRQAGWLPNTRQLTRSWFCTAGQTLTGC